MQDHNTVLRSEIDKNVVVWQSSSCRYRHVKSYYIFNETRSSADADNGLDTD